MRCHYYEIIHGRFDGMVTILLCDQYCLEHYNNLIFLFCKQSERYNYRMGKKVKIKQQ